MEIFANTLLGLLVGIVSGIYSGLVVARVARFEELRNGAKKIILGIDYIAEGEEVRIRKHDDTGKLLYVSSDLYQLGHRTAGDTVNALLRDIDGTLPQARTGAITYTALDKQYLEWQDRCRTMKPKMAVILSLKPWL